ncbi:cell morphogenesis protein-like protein Sog2 [Plenodomus tracheiphilus IPT5]|uniref:Cell morphogenesis protein-like protein Sog2 n=1 Tax=Plenodomus tracheiphilus IPT5 TaxID=1408161 RepID=A0A6A7B074_9PLEO|nr:cell morphogenesis protein-like protein Sog2 [Plenodomus tracheiphilus IPT5]
MSNDAPTPISDDEVVALTKAAFEHSRQDIGHRAAADTTPRELQQQPGITIDLGHKNIARLPDEVIDVIRTEIERLALSHNLLSTLPLRLIECKRLRYLNVRYNAMREIPAAILEMTSLEILDVSRNKIKYIPPKIANLTSLKVLAIAKNKIEALPVCLGEIGSLQVLKLDGNPLVFPPPDVCTINDKTPSPANENERDAVIATQVKRFMRQQASKERQRVELERLRIESSGDESWTESNPETPRPSKRPNGGRFPVRPSLGTIDGFPDTKADSPGIPPPPIPTRSHFRIPSTTSNGGPKRPPISPLALPNGPGSNERNRSQSEGAGPSTHRQKRMGIYTSKASELGSVDELRRTSHFRGFSQGIVVPNNSVGNGMSGPASAVGYGDTGTVRSLANRPLSDVREHRRVSRAPDIVVEAAKNFLYAISQLHDCVSHMVRSIKLTAATKDSLRRKEDFYRRYSSTYLNIRALNEVLHKFDKLVEEDEEDAQKLSRSVYMYALRCLDSFMSISLSIAENRIEIVQNANAHIMRTFLFLQQGSLIEMRNACSVLGAHFKDTSIPLRKSSAADTTATVRARPSRFRRFQTSPPQRNPYQMPPTVMLHSNDNSRSNTLTSISTATPRSGESFSTIATSMSRSNTLTSSFDEADEDGQFDRVYSKLRNASDSCRTSIPRITSLMREQYDNLLRELDSEHPRIKALAGLIEKSNEVYQMTLPLATHLSQMQLKDSFTRSQPDFWQQCMGFIKAWQELAVAYTQQGKDHKLLSSDVKQLMKPLHRTVKDASLAINDSPWSHLTSNNPGLMGPPSLSSFTSRTQHPRLYANRPNGTMSSSGGGSFPGPINTSIPVMSSVFSAHPYSTSSFGSHGSQGSGGYGTPVPATPLSAALGAAAQATIPNTPRLPSQGSNTLNVFERADRLLSNTSRRI